MFFYYENPLKLCIIVSMKNNTKILVFADVHGNYGVLEQLEKTQDYQTADMKIFLGDVVLGFARPNECIQFLAQNNCKCLLGNNDIYVCEHIPQVDLQEFSAEKIAQVEFMSGFVTQQNKEIIKTWDKQLYVRVGEKILFFTHYMWEQCGQEQSVMDYPPTKCFETRNQMFENIDADYIFFGHEHNSKEYTDGNKYFYAIGTLGVRNPGEYAVIEITGQAIKVEFKTLEFDLMQEIELVKSAGYPIIKPK